MVGNWAVTEEQRGDSEMVVCYEVSSGKPQWIHAHEHTRFSESPLRWAPLLSGLPANAPDAVAVATPSVTAIPPVITLRKVMHLLRHRPMR